TYVDHSEATEQDCANAISSAEQLVYAPAQGVAPHGSMDHDKMDQASAHAMAGLDEKGHAKAEAGHGDDHAPAGPVALQDRERGHPLVHAFTRAIPTAQCMNCHMHQPNIFLNSMLGYTMWDYEAGAPKMFPAKQK
ncbi:MAG: hypothetical protein V4521_05820, partial [Pseudomonadota bacterium]